MGGSPEHGKMSSHNGAGSYNWLNTASKDLVLPFQADVTLLMHLQVAISVSLEPVRNTSFI
jgi:hypothetical protein